MIANVDGLTVPCGLDWFATPAGVTALVIALVVAAVGAYTMDLMDQEDR